MFFTESSNHARDALPVLLYVSVACVRTLQYHNYIQSMMHLSIGRYLLSRRILTFIMLSSHLPVLSTQRYISPVSFHPRYIQISWSQTVRENKTKSRKNQDRQIKLSLMFSNAVHGCRTGSNNSEAEDYLRKEINANVPGTRRVQQNLTREIRSTKKY